MKGSGLIHNNIGNCVAAFWESSCAFVLRYVFLVLYVYLTVNLVFFPLRLLEGEFLSDCAVS